MNLTHLKKFGLFLAFFLLIQGVGFTSEATTSIMNIILATIITIMATGANCIQNSHQEEFTIERNNAL